MVDFFYNLTGGGGVCRIVFQHCVKWTDSKLAFVLNILSAL